MLNLLANIIGGDRLTWAEVLLGVCLSVVFYFFLVIVLSL
jgi:hypothetical protein